MSEIEVEIKEEFPSQGQCRICLVNAEEIYDIIGLVTEVMKDENEDSVRIFLRNIGITVHPLLPRSICRSCFNRLEDFLILRKTAEESYQKLLEMQPEIKDEPEKYMVEILEGDFDTIETSFLPFECVVCQDITDAQHDIFADSIEVDGGETRLHEILKEVLGTLPIEKNISARYLCTTCFNNLVEFHKLRDQALMTNSKFNEAKQSLQERLVVQDQTTNPPKLLQDRIEKALDPTKMKGKLVCTVCLKRFTSYYRLKRHKLTHGKERRYTCKICNKSYNYATRFYYHMKEHGKCPDYQHDEYSSNSNPSSESTKPQEWCQSPVRNKINHILYICNVCKKDYVIEYFYKKHMITHYKDLSFHCQICKYAFSTNEELEEHRKRAQAYWKSKKI